MVSLQNLLGLQGLKPMFLGFQPPRLKPRPTMSIYEIGCFRIHKYASESDSSRPADGSGNSPDSRITPQSRPSTFFASESLAMSCVRVWRQVTGSATILLLS